MTGLRYRLCNEKYSFVKYSYGHTLSLNSEAKRSCHYTSPHLTLSQLTFTFKINTQVLAFIRGQAFIAMSRMEAA